MIKLVKMYLEEKKATDDTRVIRALNDSDRPMSGWEVKQATHMRSGRVCKALTRLTEDGYVHSQWDPNEDANGMKRRLYWLA
jgi:DNA-binding PadR family transcriptional regulator